MQNMKKREKNRNRNRIEYNRQQKCIGYIENWNIIVFILLFSSFQSFYSFFLFLIPIMFLLNIILFLHITSYLFLFIHCFILYNYYIMMEDEQSPKNSTQLRIIKLLDDLNISDHEHSKLTQSKTNTQSQQLFKLKSNIGKTFENLNEKVETAISMISQIEKEKRQMVNYKKKLRLTSHFDDSIEDIIRSSKQFYDASERQLQDQQKIYANRIMETKIRNVECSENMKHELAFYGSEIVPRQIEKIQRSHLKNSNILKQRQDEVIKKVKSIKRSILQDQNQNKGEVKKMKEFILEAFQKIQQDLQKEEDNLDQGFELHFQTLQKIVGSVCDKIQ